MTLSIFYRPAPYSKGDPWTIVTTVGSADDVRDELASWMGPRLSHGDLISIVDGKNKTKQIHVFDGESSAFALAPSPPARERSWAEFWEGKAYVSKMLENASGVGPKRIAMAAVSFAETAMATYGRKVPEAVDALRDARSILVGTEIDESRLRYITAAASTGAIGRYQSENEWRVANAAANAVNAALTSSASPSSDEAAERVRSYAYTTSWAAAMTFENEKRGEVVLGDVFRGYVPLSVLLCARTGLRDPLPAPQLEGDAR